MKIWTWITSHKTVVVIALVSAAGLWAVHRIGEWRVAAAERAIGAAKAEAKAAGETIAELDKALAGKDADIAALEKSIAEWSGKYDAIRREWLSDREGLGRLEREHAAERAAAEIEHRAELERIAAESDMEVARRVERELISRGFEAAFFRAAPGGFFEANRPAADGIAALLLDFDAKVADFARLEAESLDKDRVIEKCAVADEICRNLASEQRKQIEELKSARQIEIERTLQWARANDALVAELKARARRAWWKSVKGVRDKAIIFLVGMAVDRLIVEFDR